jgi:hypothetical protein
MDNLKKLIYGLGALAAVLAVVLAVVWYKNSSLVKELELDKQNLTQEMIQLQNDYATLSSDYDAINHQLDSSREEVSQLIEKLVKTEASNRSKIRQYERELGTLRSIMKSYIVQIDSLNTLNKKLTADAAAARKEAAESKKKSEKLSKEVEQLAGQVATGAVIKARGLRLEAYNASDKITDRSSRVTYMMASLSLVENALAEKGPVRVFIRLIGPDGAMLTGDAPTAFEVAGEQMLCTASREIDYQGAEVDLSIYINRVPEYVKGHYVVEAYTSQGALGTADLMLR